MPVIPNVLERTYMLRLNRSPGPMLDLFGGMSLETALLAQDLGVFKILVDGPATPAEIAAHVDADPVALETMLAFLAQTGYVSETGDRYELTSMTETWLLESAMSSYARYFRFWRMVLYPYWRDHARESVTSTAPPTTVYEWLDEHPDRWPIAQSAFELTAEQIGEEIAAELDVPDDGSILDVGGGHGLYSIALCSRYPGVSATIFDDAAIESVATENIQAADLADRIDFTSGDYETDSLGSGYDVALLFNVIHGNDRETNRRLIESVATAVSDDGTVAILDQFGDRSRASIANTGTAFLDLTYRVTLGGRTYHTDTVREWLRVAGFEPTGSTAFEDRGMRVLFADRMTA